MFNLHITILYAIIYFLIFVISYYIEKYENTKIRKYENTKVQKYENIFVYMDKALIEQLLNSKISLKKTKFIIDNIDKITNIQENEPIITNTNNLKIMTCQGCHSVKYEDKFFLNKTQKRYRSCINCVIRSRDARRHKTKPTHNNIDNTPEIPLSQIYNIEPNINVYLTDSLKIDKLYDIEPNNIDEKKEENIKVIDNVCPNNIDEKKEENIKVIDNVCPIIKKYNRQTKKHITSIFNDDGELTMDIDFSKSIYDMFKR